MKKNKRRTMLGFGLLFFGTSLFAQQAVVTAGGSASGGATSIDYAIGQVVYASATGTGGTVLQGVQVPYEITTTTGIAQTGITLQCVVYPNPATTRVMLKIDDTGLEPLHATSLQYTLYNSNGIKLLQQAITGIETDITLEQYPSGSYFLQISNNNSLITSFTIIKK